MKVKVALLALAASYALCACASSSENSQAESSSQEAVNSSTQDTVVVSMDWPYYNSVSELSEASDIIVTGKVVSVEEKLINILLDGEHYVPHYVYTVSVDTVIKGGLSVGDELEVPILGGTKDGVAYACIDSITLNEGEEYLISASCTDGTYMEPINYSQGCVKVDTASDSISFDGGSTVYTLDELGEQINAASAK